MATEHDSLDHLETLPPAQHAAIEVELLMNEPAVAREVLRQLDLALHPWGEPGVVPEEPGLYWWSWEDADIDDEQDGTPLRAELLMAPRGPEWHVECWPHVIATAEQLRTSVDGHTGRRSMFRKRWTPEAP